MPLSNDQQFELDQFRKEIERDNPTDLLQFGSNYFNKKLEIQRNFIKNQEDLALSKGIVLFPPMSQHDSISLPPSHSQSSFSMSASNKSTNNRSGSKIGLNDLKDNNGSDSNVTFKSPFADNDPHSTENNMTPTSSAQQQQQNIIIDAPSPSNNRNNNNNNDNDNDNNSNSNSSNNDSTSNLFKGGFNIGQESRKRINSPLDPSDSTTKRKSTPTPENQQTPENDKIQQYRPLPSRFNAERRTSVSGETLQPDHFDDWTPEHYKEKTDEQLKRLEKSIGKNFLFNKLDSDSKRLVINCLEEKHVKNNDIIIKQGDEGDYFYIVESGTVEFYVNDTKVNTSGPGSSFGELALMYNNPRAATVIATADCILWALDRLTFRKILLGSSFKKRVMYDDLLKSIPVLKSLTTYDRSKLADALDTKIYEPNEIIIREGDVGENFYLIEYGDVDVIKENKGVLTTLHKGDYFGEVALLNDLPRQATIKTKNRTKVATLGKSGFQRLLGPVVEVLKLNDPTREERDRAKN